MGFAYAARLRRLRAGPVEGRNCDASQTVTGRRAHQNMMKAQPVAGITVTLVAQPSRGDGDADDDLRLVHAWGPGPPAPLAHDWRG
jgi:hypothetical protein